MCLLRNWARFFEAFGRVEAGNKLGRTLNLVTQEPIKILALQLSAPKPQQISS